MDLTGLKELGWSEGEVRVYAAVLESGIGSLNKIQEKTGIERRNIYDILNKLIEKGFVSYTLEKGKKTYQCIHPGKIREEIRRRTTALRKLEEKIPEVEDLFAAHKPSIRAEVYRGNEGIKALLEEGLEYGESYWMGGNSFEDYQAVPKGLQIWWENWMKRRAQAKHLMHALVSYGTHLKGLKPGDVEEQKKQCYKYCALPKGLNTPMVLIVFGDRVAQVLWSAQSFAFVLESEKMRDSYLKYFKYFWKAPW